MTRMSETVLIFKGEFCEVRITQKMKSAFSQIDARDRARLKVWMRSYADDGPKNLDDQKFKFEGRHASGAATGKLAVYTFKSRQVRMYGCHFDNQFLITEIDAAKKQNKADQQKLENAAKRCAAFMS